MSAFLQVVLENPTRWRLILTMPDTAPREYRDALRTARSSILAQAELLATALRQQFAVNRCHLSAGRQHQFAHAHRVGLTLRRLHHGADDGTGGLYFAASDLLCHIGIGGQRLVHRRLDQ